MAQNKLRIESFKRSELITCTAWCDSNPHTYAIERHFYPVERNKKIMFIMKFWVCFRRLKNLMRDERKYQVNPVWCIIFISQWLKFKDYAVYISLKLTIAFYFGEIDTKASNCGFRSTSQRQCRICFNDT